MASEAVMAVGGLVIRPMRLHKQPRRAQDIEQPITAHSDIRLLQRHLQHPLQFASAYARLAQSHLGDQRANPGIPGGLPKLTVAALVVCLAADAEVTASPANA
ncbi:hypothetical protein Tamer19_57000 [Cupriavidus sp. TA19]|nr:hypothetical protein Tamer19_57000 [Cupriavidus sp. TA19]